MIPEAIEMILTKQLASYLAMPIFVADADGNLVYFNEPAEAILGQRFDETGRLPLAERLGIFAAIDEEGKPVPPESMPLVVALNECRPNHRRLWMHGLDGKLRHLEIMAFPLSCGEDEHVGAVSIFWELNEDGTHKVGKEP
jgi:PAS domain-containing protein